MTPEQRSPPRQTAGLVALACGSALLFLVLAALATLNGRVEDPVPPKRRKRRSSESRNGESADSTDSAVESVSTVDTV